MSLDAIERKLLDYLRGIPKLVVLVSGGADSALLAEAARRAAPAEPPILSHALLPFSPPEETDFIKDFAAERGLELVVVPVPLLENAEVASNGPERCYHCKKAILEAVSADPRIPRSAVFADGTVLDDYGDYRPGLRATEEAGILRPLAGNGIGKREVRLLARRYGIPFWNRPASACLASRVPTGSRITREKLYMVSEAESRLSARGFRGCRVRCLDGSVASVEVAKIHLRRLRRLEDEIRPELLAVGFAEVRINPLGYTKGAMNAASRRK
jgi:uncharacterized protein